MKAGHFSHLVVQCVGQVPPSCHPACLHRWGRAERGGSVQWPTPVITDAMHGVRCFFPLFMSFSSDVYYPVRPYGVAYSAEQQFTAVFMQRADETTRFTPF